MTYYGLKIVFNNGIIVIAVNEYSEEQISLAKKMYIVYC
jgi:hypothetical protein